eukprot:1181082-Prymnesium_polylepis.1
MGELGVLARGDGGSRPPEQQIGCAQPNADWVDQDSEPCEYHRVSVLRCVAFDLDVGNEPSAALRKIIVKIEIVARKAFERDCGDQRIDQEHRPHEHWHALSEHHRSFRLRCGDPELDGAFRIACGPDTHPQGDSGYDYNCNGRWHQHPEDEPCIVAGETKALQLPV